jgi:hypothetical protein
VASFLGFRTPRGTVEHRRSTVETVETDDRRSPPSLLSQWFAAKVGTGKRAVPIANPGAGIEEDRRPLTRAADGATSPQGER